MKAEATSYITLWSYIEPALGILTTTFVASRFLLKGSTPQSLLELFEPKPGDRRGVNIGAFGFAMFFIVINFLVPLHTV